MTDPLGVASTAVGLLNGTISLLKEAKEAAKRSEDHDLKDKLNEIYDAFLELKEVIGNLRDENAELRKKIETQKSLNWDSKLKVYFAENDPDPFCPVCMDLNQKQVRLHPDYDYNVVWRYDCKVCKNYFMVPD